MSFGHWTFLRILWEHEGLTRRGLSEQAGVAEPTAFSALRAMERLGYVVRCRMDGDCKKSHVFLTPKGKRLKNQLVPLAETVNRIAIRGLNPGGVNTTRDVLMAIISNLAEDELERDMPMPSTRALQHVRAGTGLRQRNA